MRKELGALCMAIGVALLVGSLSLFLWNQTESDRAKQSSMDVIPLMNDAVRSAQETMDAFVQPGILPEKKQMTEVEIDGNSYIGYLSVPSLNLDLPVMSQWDYPKLKIAPCRYSGTTMEENLVLVAHNYRSHFGLFHQLQLGDAVLFVDMDGVVTAYQVEAVDVVLPNSVKEVTAGAFDLALVTCTYGGKTRLVVYCDMSFAAK